MSIPGMSRECWWRRCPNLGATNLVVYLVDFEQRLLEPIRDQSAQSALAETEEVGVSVAGRAFVERQAQVVERPDGTRVWVPIVEGSDPTGVLALTVPAINDETMRLCEELGVLAGYLVATHARVTDLYNLHRRRRSMTLAASMQWDLLPPLTIRTRRVAAAGMIEPPTRWAATASTTPSTSLTSTSPSWIPWATGYARRWRPEWPSVPTDTVVARATAWAHP